MNPDEGGSGAESAADLFAEAYRTYLKAVQQSGPRSTSTTSPTRSPRTTASSTAARIPGLRRGRVQHRRQRRYVRKPRKFGGCWAASAPSGPPRATSSSPRALTRRPPRTTATSRPEVLDAARQAALATLLGDQNRRFPRYPRLVADVRVFRMPDGLGVRFTRVTLPRCCAAPRSTSGGLPAPPPRRQHRDRAAGGGRSGRRPPASLARTLGLLQRRVAGRRRRARRPRGDRSGAAAPAALLGTPRRRDAVGGQRDRGSAPPRRHPLRGLRDRDLRSSHRRPSWPAPAAPTCAC